MAKSWTFLVVAFALCSLFLLWWSFSHATHSVVFPVTDDSPVEEVNHGSSKTRESLANPRSDDAADNNIINNNNNNVDECMIREANSGKKVLAIGSHPIGTYICSYFLGQKNAVHDSPSKKSCTLTCPLVLPSASSSSGNDHNGPHQSGSKKTFECRIQEKSSSSLVKSATAWDFMVFHYGAPPAAPDPARQMVIFYSGESNITEAKRAKPEYQKKFHHVVSCHHTRRFYFTWTARFRQDFLSIVSSSKNSVAEEDKMSAADLRKKWHDRIDGVVVFVSRCGKGGRDKIIEALRTNGIRVHSFGKCQRTHLIAKEHPDCVNVKRDGPLDEKKGIDRYAEKLCVYRKYRYVLALDNTNEEDYVTEKIYHAFVTGAIPLYDGAPNIEEFVPTPSSYIPLSRYLIAAGEHQNKKQEEESRRQEQQQQQQLLHQAAGRGRSATTIALPRLRSDPKRFLDFEKLKADLKALDAAGAAVVGGVGGAGGDDGGNKNNNPSNKLLEKEEKSAATYWLDALLGWQRTGTKSWSKKFWENLHHPEPTCDICNLALQRRCQRNA